jgi:hypothetical protein
LAQEIVSGWRTRATPRPGKDVVPFIAETIDVRDEEWRAWLERLKPKLGYARSWTLLERDDPPPDKR